MNKIPLKPCPFCGGSAKMIFAVDEAWVMCGVCQSSCGMSTACGEKAAQAWNKRWSPEDDEAKHHAYEISLAHG